MEGRHEGNRIQAVIFDLNGTLIERRSRSSSVRDCVRWFASMKLGREAPPFLLQDDLPVSTRSYLQSVFPSVEPDIMDEYMKWETLNFDPAWMRKSPWAIECIACLREFHQLALVTNNYRSYVDAILEAHGWTSVFSYVGTLETARKPDPMAFQAALRALGLEPESCCAVGDKWKYDVAPMLDLHGSGYEIEWGGLRRFAELLVPTS